ncbi:MAG TPA: TIGR03118 family protein [Anaeromyxobacter sp.]|nr:TIGR03118 family protein [Anaeromyxobacter sp.]
MRSAITAASAATLILCGCGGGGSMPAAGTADNEAAAAAAGVALDPSVLSTGRHGTYVQRDLVSDGAVAAEHTDPNLKNAWGLDALPSTPWWVADNATGESTLYDAEGIAQPTTPGPLVVTIPGVSGPGAPSGLSANPTNDFPVTIEGVTAPARFIFASEDGTISAWTRSATLVPTTAAVVVPSIDGAVFKGLALASTRTGSRLFATDFHNGLIRVYDGAFRPVSLPSGAFTDPDIPQGFAPFGIRRIAGVLLVTYAMQDADRHDDVKGPGFGFVDAYSTGGRLLARIASRGKLNSPWGITLAPPRFGQHGLRLLVGNFGDGHIISFGLRRDGGPERGDDQRGDLDDEGVYLMGQSGPIVIDGLWALSFGNGGPAGPSNTLFFTAGPNDENDGLFGRIDFAPQAR